MEHQHVVEAAEREQGGVRELRRTGVVPGVIYGGKKQVLFSCDARHLQALLQDESFRSSVVEVRLQNGDRHRTLLREVQRHPVRRDILHVDFQEVRADREISAQVPLHYINVESSPGVKLRSGIFTAIENQISVHCLPQNLPEFIEVDAGALDIGKSIHLSEISPPEGVRFDDIVRGNDLALAAIVGATVEEEPEAAPAAAEDETPAAPAASE